MDDGSPNKRELGDALRIIIGGGLAGVAFSGIQLLFEPLSTPLEYGIVILFGVVFIMALVWGTAFYFRIVERSVPHPIVRLHKEEKDEIVDRVVERLDQEEIDD